MNKFFMLKQGSKSRNEDIYIIFNYSFISTRRIYE